MDPRIDIKWLKESQYEDPPNPVSRFRLLHAHVLRKVPEAFGLASSKSWYPHYFNTKVNLEYVGPIPDIEYYSADEMSEGSGGNTWPGIMSRKSRSSTIGTG